MTSPSKGGGNLVKSWVTKLLLWSNFIKAINKVTRGEGVKDMRKLG